MTGHTPGPWEEIETESSVDLEYPDGGRISGWQDIGTSDGEVVAIALFRDVADYRDGDARGGANARLIAAAPDMLKALKLAVQAYGPWSGKTCKQERADAAIDAAIRKAEGGE